MFGNPFNLVEGQRTSHALVGECGSGAAHLYYNALESCPCRGERRWRPAEGGTSAGGALPDLLATCFFVRLPSWIFARGRAGHYAGVLPDDSENKLAAAGGPKPRPLPLAVAQVS